MNEALAATLAGLAVVGILAAAAAWYAVLPTIGLLWLVGLL